MPNRLISETSPYLLQHAHNPVDWYPWGREALDKAQSENKPILVSIGYAACHWCHVMERESFEDQETADLMNRLFVNIKIDREERPDLDHIYMEAVQTITGSGGWPLNVFLTPSKKPFYGGTYFPPTPIYNRPSWKDVLTSISSAFHEKRHEIDAHAENLTDQLNASNRLGLAATEDGNKLFDREELGELANNLLKTADTKDGGFGRAPKFPQTFSIRFLLQHHFYTKDPKALAQACLSLDKMIDGGINDQIGGGFARYSTDEVWLAPHFEKMLYDNALLVMALSEAYQITGRSKYLEAINSTLDFAERELLSPEGGFYAALDADSEGVEGKFYVWSAEEINEVLGEDADLFSRYYDITPGGNWEHTNILRELIPPETFAKENGLEMHRLEEILRISREKLLVRRSGRVRPQTDDKILLGWNAMMNTAYSKAFEATGNEKYRMLAVSNMKFLLARFQGEKDVEFRHTYKDGEARFPAFLDDYAQLIEALIHLQEITGDQTYLRKVKSLVKSVIEQFSEEESSYFYFTNQQQEDVILRKKELYDGATPSGNSLMAWNLAYAGILFDNQEWKERAVNMCTGLREVIRKYPGSFGVWASVMQGLSMGIPEIALTGSSAGAIHKELLRIFIPFRVIQSSPSEAPDFPLLAGKSFSTTPMIYLCKDYSCQSPVNQLDALKILLAKLF
ncbi:MAG TPA: thioredoxin domain-containing protein [Flavitalea sp.]|nr:thioredoxin domain-containing protein [Flavitalea sp.]